MPLPAIAVIATKLGIEVAKYLIKKEGKEVLKKGAATQLRNRIAAKAAKKSTKRTSRPPTKAQTDATKARNRAKEKAEKSSRTRPEKLAALKRIREAHLSHRDYKTISKFKAKQRVDTDLAIKKSKAIDKQKLKSKV
tara:strand:- start:74 stop:484 length:411 start_codon:yes stop_codon:yes gene_type:complete